MPFVWFLVAAFVLYVLWYSVASPWKVQIKFVPDCPLKIHGLPNVKHSEIETFFQSDLNLQEAIQVMARKEESGRLIVKFYGHVDAGTKQRIRNMLMNEI